MEDGVATEIATGVQSAAQHFDSHGADKIVLVATLEDYAAQ